MGVDEIAVSTEQAPLMADEAPAVRLLLVAAEHAEYMLFAHLLAASRSRFELAWCRDYGSALHRLSSSDYSVVLLDWVRDPERAALLVGQMREQGLFIPVIALAETTPEADAHWPPGVADVLGREGLDRRVLERAIHYVCVRTEVERRLSAQDRCDALTGLPNRLRFREQLAASLELAERSGRRLALLTIDLDGFARVNDGFGFDSGDELLRLVARRLEQCVRKTDYLGRLGNDEFAVLLENVRTLPDVAAVAGKLVHALGESFELENHNVVLAASIGIAVYPDAGDTPDRLLRHADLARKQAKQSRGSEYRFYSERMNLEAVNQLHLEVDLRRALRRGEFELFYQPRIELESGRMVGVEGLIRWRHPKRGLLSPAEFIPLAEEVGLIVPIGYWVIQQACADLQRLCQLGHEDLDMAINLSFRQLQDSRFVETATRLIRDSGVDPSRLEFELTETAIMTHVEETYQGMMALHQLGVSFSLDDFGTGYSSFAHIQRLPIAALKIDRGFIRNVLGNEDDAIIVKAVISLAHSLQLQVIAEGVETLDQVQFLWQHRCDQVQGYYFSPATSLEHLEKLLRNHGRFETSG